MNDAPLVAPPIIQKLKAPHHAAARALASGMSVRNTAVLVGRTPQRISDLMSDPAFQDLVARYRESFEEIDVSDKRELEGVVTDIGRMAAEEIQERLDDPEARSKMTVTELRQLMGDSLDRTVLPTKTAVPNISIPTRITLRIGEKDLRPTSDQLKAIDVVAPEIKKGKGEKDESASAQSSKPLLMEHSGKAPNNLGGPGSPEARNGDRPSNRAPDC